MSRYLPGNVRDRLIELRKTRGLSQNDVADIIKCDRVTYGRVENGTSSLKCEDLIALAKYYDLPTDYILGLVDTPEKTYYEIRELGLSVEAAEKLYSGKANPRVINELLLNDNFITAVNRMAMYFSESMSGAIRTSNELKDFTYSFLEDLIKGGELPNDRETNMLKNEIKLSKEPPNYYDTDRIKNLIMISVKEIKEKIDAETKEAREARKLLDDEILKCMKQETMKVQYGRKLSKEQQVKKMTEAVKKALSIDPNMTPEMIEELTPGIIKQFEILSNYGKR